MEITNKKKSKKARGKGKVMKGKGVREEDQVARVPNNHIWIFHAIFYLITRYFTTVWANRWLSYGLFEQLEILHIILYFLLAWNRYNIKFKRARMETLVGDYQASFRLLGGNGGETQITQIIWELIESQEAQYSQIDPKDKDFSYLFILLRKLIKEYDRSLTHLDESDLLISITLTANLSNLSKHTGFREAALNRILRKMILDRRTQIFNQFNQGMDTSRFSSEQKRVIENKLLFPQQTLDEIINNK